ncbi:transposase [Gluconobacter oxydans]|uniref:transposase n=1 Tax=Gluconobacter TaxID=441 RepID=UPI0009BA7F50
MQPDIATNRDARSAAWRFVLSSNLSRTHIASDLEISKSALEHWISQYQMTDLTVPAVETDLAQENKRLCLETRVLHSGDEGDPRKKSM